MRRAFFLILAVLTRAVAQSDSGPAELRPRGLRCLASGFSSQGILSGHFSPDGRQILFNGRRHNDRIDGIYLVNADGSGLRRVFRGSSPVFAPAWSPDGTRFAFNAGPSIYEYSLAEDHLRRRARDALCDAGAPTWHPDETGILYCSALGLRFLPRGAYQSAEFLRIPGSELRDPSYAPDGSLIAFVTSQASDYQVAVVKPGSSSPTLLTAGPAFRAHPAWSPDCRFLVYEEAPQGQGTGGSRICLYDFATRTARTLLAEHTLKDPGPVLAWRSPSIAPDGRALLVTRVLPQAQELCLVELGGSAQALAQPAPAVVEPARPTTERDRASSQPEQISDSRPRIPSQIPEVKVPPLLPTTDSSSNSPAAESSANPKPEPRPLALDSVMPDTGVRAEWTEYRIVIFAHERSLGWAFLHHLEKLGFVNPASYVTAPPVNRFVLKHNQAPSAMLDKLVEAAAKTLNVRLETEEEPRLPEKTVYINLPEKP